VHKLFFLQADRIFSFQFGSSSSFSSICSIFNIYKKYLFRSIESNQLLYVFKDIQQ
jgi:hypothetical protein